jgi:hypothetical protein
MNSQQSTTIPGKHHPENARGEGTKFVAIFSKTAMHLD